MVEKATVDRSSRFKAVLVIRLFTMMNNSDRSCPLAFGSQYREQVTSHVKVAKDSRVRLRLTMGT